jgi:hypothetical protein
MLPVRRQGGRDDIREDGFDGILGDGVNIRLGKEVEHARDFNLRGATIQRYNDDSDDRRKGGPEARFSVPNAACFHGEISSNDETILSKIGGEGYGAKRGLFDPFMAPKT